MTTDAVGGVWTYSMELSRALAARGVEVTLATMGPRPSDEQRAQARAVPGLSLVEADFKLEWMQEPWEDVEAAGEWLLALEKERRPDVVHLNGYCHAALDWRAPTLVAAHSCIYGWWEAVHGRRPPEEYARYRAEVTRGLRAAGMVVAPTRAMLDTLAHHYQCPPGGRVVPNGRGPGGFRAGEKEEFVLAAGRLWDPAKGMAALDSAAKGAPWPVRVAGEATHPDDATAATFRNAQPLGRVSDGELRDLLARASVFAHPAFYEPFGLGPVEAAMSGCALVLADIPTLREVWGGAALFVPPGDPVTLRSALSSMARSPRLREGFAEAAGERALQLYTADRMGAAYASLYAELAPQAAVPEEPPCAS